MKASKSEIANRIATATDIYDVTIQGHNEPVSCQDAIDFLDTYKGSEKFAYSYGNLIASGKHEFFIWIN